MGPLRHRHLAGDGRPGPSRVIKKFGDNPGPVSPMLAQPDPDRRGMGRLLPRSRTSGMVGFLPGLGKPHADVDKMGYVEVGGYPAAMMVRAAT